MVGNEVMKQLSYSSFPAHGSLLPILPVNTVINCVGCRREMTYLENFQHIPLFCLALKNNQVQNILLKYFGQCTQWCFLNEALKFMFHFSASEINLITLNQLPPRRHQKDLSHASLFLNTFINVYAKNKGHFMEHMRLYIYIYSHFMNSKAKSTHKDAVIISV